MKATNMTKYFLILGLILISSCQESNLGQTQPATVIPQDHTFTFQGLDEKINGGLKTISKIDKLHLELTGIGLRNFDGGVVQQLRPVDFIFVLDTSSSMEDQLNAIKNNVTNIVDNLANQSATARFGVVAFVDAYGGDGFQTSIRNLGGVLYDTKIDPLTGQRPGLEQFKNQLNPINFGYQREQNTDYAEGSLMAIKEAIRIFDNNTPADINTVRMVGLMTDEAGHNGRKNPQYISGTTQIDCRISYTSSASGSLFDQKGVVETINDYAAKIGQDKFKLWYSVAPVSRAQNGQPRCSNYQTAVDQMNDIMARILPSQVQKGGELTYSGGRIWSLFNNFSSTSASSDAIVNSIVDAIGTSIPQSDNLQCFAQEANLIDLENQSSLPLYSWQISAAEKTNVLNGGNVSNVIRLDNVLSQVQTLKPNMYLGLMVERCCIKPGNTIGATCDQILNQAINYQVNVADVPVVGIPATANPNGTIQ